jgi:hypothetical protein
MTTSTSNGLSIGAKAGIGASVPIIAIALAGCGFWLFLRRKHKLTPGHGYDLAESCGNIGDRRDADLPELVERKAPRLVYDVKGQGRIKPTDSSYESELLSRSTLEDTASSRMRQSLVAYHDYPKHIQEMGSSNTELTALQSPKVQPLHELGVADTTRSFSAPKMDAASSIPTISPSGGIPHRTDEEVAKLEAEYVNLQERRQRLLELNRLDEEERRLKKRIEERLGQP